jgi:glyoxylase I family protein
VMYMCGDTRLFFTRSAQPGKGKYEKEKPGLNHIAFGVRTLEELQTIQGQLDAGEISRTGIKLWQDGLTKYIWLDDPDGMRIEFWLRPR